MSPEKQAILYHDFPLLFEDVNFECGDGWYELIRELSTKLSPLVEKSRMTCNEYDIYPSVEQVNESYGSLRFCMGNPTDEMQDLIHEAEDHSQDICELCGEEGNIDFSKYWVVTRCKTCSRL